MTNILAFVVDISASEYYCLFTDTLSQQYSFTSFNPPLFSELDVETRTEFVRRFNALKEAEKNMADFQQSFFNLYRHRDVCVLNIKS